ncbi:MAG: glycosyltransferase family 39 protein [Planctomycetota bacterium]
MENRANEAADSPESESQLKNSQNWLLYVAVLLVSISVAQLLLLGGPLIGFEHELRFGEAIVLDQARRVTEDPGLYPELGKEPWLLDQYAPFYPWLARILTEFSTTPYGGGRTLSLLATLVSATMLALIVQRFSGTAIGLICAAAMLSMLEFLEFGFLMRVDSLALAFAMIGCWCTLQEGHRKRIFGAVAFFFAVYTRQTMLALLLVSYGELFLREGRQALRWPAGLLVAGLAFYGGLSAMTGGMFHEHAVRSNLFPFAWDQGIQKAFGSFIPWKIPWFLATFLALAPAPGNSGLSRWRWAPMILAFLLVIPPLRAWQQGALGRPDLDPLLLGHGLLALSAVAALLRRDLFDRVNGIRILLALISTSLIARIGSDLNYLFEAGVLTLLVCGTSIGRVSTRRAMVITILLVIQVLFGIYQCRGISVFQPDRLEEIQYRQEVIDNLVRYPDPILSEEPWALAQSSRPLQIEPYTARQMYESGMWDGKELVAAIEQQKFSAILRAKQRYWAGYDTTANGQKRVYFGPWTFNGVRSFPAKIQEAIEKNYRAVSGTSMVERVTSKYLEGREIWEPIPR